MPIDIDALKESTNLAALIESDLGPACKKNGRWLMWHCPFHADKEPSLAVTADNGRWHCFGCGESGDAIEWVMRRQGLSFKEACQQLGAMPSLPAPTVRKATLATSKDDGPPSADWQEKAQIIVDEAVEALWSEAGQSARDYLHQRGLTDDTLRRWHIGYNPPREVSDWPSLRKEPESEGGLLYRVLHGKKVCAGVLIPCYFEGVLWGVKIKPPKKRARYRGISGGKKALLGTETLADHSVAVLCEGEFDAMLLEQECGDLVGVATSTAPMSNWRTSWTPHFLHCQRVLVAYDTDLPGERHAKKLVAMMNRARRMAPPIGLPAGKDITDYHGQGGDLRAWVSFYLAREEVAQEVAPQEEEQPAPEARPGADKELSGDLTALQQLDDAWERWHILEERLAEAREDSDASNVAVQGDLVRLRLAAAQAERAFYDAEKEYTASLSGQPSGTPLRASGEAENYVMLLWPADAPAVTIGEKWHKRRSGEIEAAYTREELTLCLSLMRQEATPEQTKLFEGVT